MLTLYIRKTTGGTLSDYEYIVMANAEQIASGEIPSHRRNDGWAALVKRIAEHMEEAYDEKDT
jgi:hypothetical protein